MNCFNVHSGADPSFLCQPRIKQLYIMLEFGSCMKRTKTEFKNKIAPGFDTFCESLSDY